jgi:hypothetical protein
MDVGVINHGRLGGQGRYGGDAQSHGAAAGVAGE